MTAFGLTLAFLLLAGLAVARISSILMNGSIFGSFREFLAAGADGDLDVQQTGYDCCTDTYYNEYFGDLVGWRKYVVPPIAKLASPWAFGKLKELFECDLCMTTQVSIWFVAVPTTIVVWTTHVVRYAFGYSGFGELMLVLLAGFLVAMAVSGVGRFLIYALDFPRKATEELTRYISETIEASERQFDATLAESQRQFDVRRRDAIDAERRQQEAKGLEALKLLLALKGVGMPRGGSPFGGLGSDPVSSLFGADISGLTDDPYDTSARSSYRDAFRMDEPAYGNGNGNGASVGLGEFRRGIVSALRKYDHITCPFKRANNRYAAVTQWANSIGAGNRIDKLEGLVIEYERSRVNGKVSDERLRELFGQYRDIVQGRSVDANYASAAGRDSW